MADPYISEVKYKGGAASDFVEVVVDEGADVSLIQVVVYNPNGTVKSTNSLGTLVDTIAGKDIYVISAGINKRGAVALADDGTVLAFVSFNKVVDADPGEGPAAGMSSTQIGTTNGSQSLGSEDGSSYAAQTPDAGVVPCFLRGTRIETDKGMKKVENLLAGDRIAKASGGYAELRWIGSVSIPIEGENEKHAPVHIRKHALGRGIPKRDLWVSPNHRVLLCSPDFELYFSDTEVLIPAKHLVGWMGIDIDTSIKLPEYHHLLFDEHQVILSEGLRTESFHPGDSVLEGMSEATLLELMTLFPELAQETNGYGETARPCLRSFETGVATTLVQDIQGLIASPNDLRPQKLPKRRSA